MWKRVLLALGLLILLGATGIASAVWLTTPPSGITEENAHRLRMGMTEAQVDAIFGSPGVLINEYEEPKCYEKRWAADDLEIVVTFDATDQRMDGGTLTKDLPPERPGESRQKIWFLGRHLSVMERVHRWLER